MNEMNKNNKVTLVGIIASDFVFSHEVFGEKFYLIDLEVERISGTTDKIPLMISERLIDVTEGFHGLCLVKVEGYFRSYNLNEDGKSRLILSVFVTDICDAGTLKNTNIITLEGFVVKKPVYRTTPLGREITDFLFAVNRAYGKSDYIPCIAWGRNARYISNLEVGAKLWLEGRIQSRTYEKQVSLKKIEVRTAYEVSVSKFKILGANR